MPVYEYKALNSEGKNKTGIMDADSPAAARQKLRGSGMFPVEIKEAASVATPRGTVKSSASLTTFFARVKPEEVSVATRQLATLTSAGVPLVTALDALVGQLGNTLFAKNMAQIKESVNEGNSLAFALAQHPKLFSNIYVNMVRAGEASGSLDVVLERLADYSENEQALKGKVRSALAYPVFMCLVGVAVVVLLMTYVVPNITGMFNQLRATLPLPTRILIASSSFFKSYWWVIVLGIVGAVALLKKFFKTSQGARFADTIMLRAPILGPVIQKIALSRFSRTLGTLLESGVPLLAALDIVRNIVDNTLLAEAIENASEDIEAGKSLALPLSRSPWFPPITVQMISVGEQSGELESMLKKIADSYERDVHSQIQTMTSLLEPLMILVMGVVVAFIVMSILMPIIETTQMMK